MKTISISCGFCQTAVEKSEYEVTRSTKLGRSLYCSLSCGAKHSAQKRNQKVWNIEEYNANPDKCKCCNAALPYQKKYNTFCNQSCAATFNNPFKKVNEEKIKNVKPDIKKSCLNCGNEMVNVIASRKYCCSKCSEEYRREETYKKIESGGKVEVRPLKRYIISKRGNKCEDCGWDKVNPKTGNCPIELEHIDGNSENNSLDNLKLLCPNCHSLTSTYKNLNKGNGRHSRRKRYAEGKSY